MNSCDIISFSLSKRVADRVASTGNTTQIMRTAYGRIDKQNRGTGECDLDFEYSRIEDACMECLVQTSELLSVVREARRRLAPVEGGDAVGQ